MLISECLIKSSDAATPIYCLDSKSLPAFLESLPPASRSYVSSTGFEGKAGSILLLPSIEGAGIGSVLFGLGEKGSLERTPFLPGKVASLVPAGSYYYANEVDHITLATLAFALETYRFKKYRGGATAPTVFLNLSEKVDLDLVSNLANAVAFGRSLINTPANDMGPDELSEAAEALCRTHGAAFSMVKGDLLKSGFPLIAAVGQGSDRAPRLIDFTWGEEKDPKITLVGKGVVFDTGGLDIKSPSNMFLMKKDMGGAACVLALAQMIMTAELPVRLRVILPVVENSVSGNSFRPSDVFESRKGLTVEIGDTDAEGRLILADALTLADEESPDLLIDMATLTGAARVALGPELPPFYTVDEKLAAELQKHSEEQFDPLWRMPLWRSYLPMLESKIADTSNITGNAFAGSITAALFLSKFVSTKSWLHIDAYAWNASSKPGRPEGGEVQAARALFALISARYGKA